MKENQHPTLKTQEVFPYLIMCEPDCLVHTDPGLSREGPSTLVRALCFIQSTNSTLYRKLLKDTFKQILNQIPGQPIDKSEKHTNLTITMMHAYNPTKFNKTKKWLDFFTISTCLVEQHGQISLVSYSFISYKISQFCFFVVIGFLLF